MATSCIWVRLLGGGLVFLLYRWGQCVHAGSVVTQTQQEAEPLNSNHLQHRDFCRGLLALAAVQNIPLLFAVTALISFGFGVQYITLNTLISLSAPTEAQGGTLGVAWAIAGLAKTAAPILSAATFALGIGAGFGGLVFVVSAVIAVATVPLVLSFKKISRDNVSG